MRKINYISSFEVGADLHGGTLRTMQIREILNERYMDVQELRFDFQIKAGSLLSLPVLSHPSFSKYIFKGLSLSGGIKLASLFQQVKKRIAKNSCVCLEVCGANSILLGHALIEHGCRLICFPHNLEALVRGVNTRIYSDEFSWMRMELELYRRSAQVFAISSFDRAVLGCLGVDSELFPYYPSRKRLESLNKIRETREDYEAGGDPLLFSSVNNPPTRTAVSSFIKELASHEASCNFELTVAGRGTEIFLPFACSNIAVKGEIDEDQARQLQEQASISIVPAIQTSGFLTKLVENNLIKLPTLVLGNYLQANSMEEYGIFLQENSPVAETIFTLAESFNSSFRKFERPGIEMNFKECSL